MLDAMLLLSKYQVHRLPVVTSGGDIVNMITQSNVVAMLVSSNVDGGQTELCVCVCVCVEPSSG